MRQTEHPLAQAQYALNAMQLDPLLTNFDLPRMAPAGEFEAQLRLDTAHGLLLARQGKHEEAYRTFELAYHLAHAAGASFFTSQLEWDMRSARGAYGDKEVAQAQAALDALLKDPNADPLQRDYFLEELFWMRLYNGQIWLAHDLLSLMPEEKRTELRAVSEAFLVVDVEPPTVRTPRGAFGQLAVMSLGSVRLQEEGRQGEAAELAVRAHELSLRLPELRGFENHILLLQTRAMLSAGQYGKAAKLSAANLSGSTILKSCFAAVPFEAAILGGESDQKKANASKQLIATVQKTGESARQTARMMSLMFPNAAAYAAKHSGMAEFASEVSSSVILFLADGPQPQKPAYRRKLRARKTGGIAYVGALPKD